MIDVDEVKIKWWVWSIIALGIALIILTAQCIVVYAANRHPKYQLALAANRDEWLDRPTEAASKHFFGNEGDGKEECISGIDKLMQGTWIGVSKSGKIAAL